METLFALLIGLLFAAAIYMMLRRSIVKLVIALPSCQLPCQPGGFHAHLVVAPSTRWLPRPLKNLEPALCI